MISQELSPLSRLRLHQRHAGPMTREHRRDSGFLFIPQNTTLDCLISVEERAHQDCKGPDEVLISVLGDCAQHLVQQRLLLRPRTSSCHPEKCWLRGASEAPAVIRTHAPALLTAGCRLRELVESVDQLANRRLLLAFSGFGTLVDNHDRCILFIIRGFLLQRPVSCLHNARVVLSCHPICLTVGKKRVHMWQ